MGIQSIARTRFTPAERPLRQAAFAIRCRKMIAFAAKAGISVASLSQWLRRGKGRDEAPEFVEMPRLISSTGAVGSGGI